MAGRPKPSKSELDQKNQARRDEWLAKLGNRELSTDLSDAAPHLSDWNQENIQALHGLQRGDVEPLITLLENMECGLHPDLRLWLASMLKGETETKWWLAIKRHPGYRHADTSDIAVRNLVAGKRIHELWNQGNTISQAKDSVASEYDRETRTIDNIWISYRNVYFRLQAEGIELAPELQPLRRPKNSR